MTNKTTMSRSELLETAAADALGLLDEFEADQFDRNFRQAPPAIQDEVKELQAEIAADTTLLPDVTPPAELRQRILDHLAKRIDEETAQLAPLATIGQRNGSAASNILARNRRMLLSHDAWRAAAIILVGVVVAIAIFAYGAYNRANLLVDVALNMRTQEQLEDHVGNDLLSFIRNPSCVQITLVSTDESQRGMGHLWIHERDNEAFLLTMDVPQSDGELVLSAVLADGTELLNLARFEPRPITGQRFSMDSDLLITATFTVTDASGNVILSSVPTGPTVAYASSLRPDHSAS